MKKEELFYDHYKDTFQQQKEYLAKREKYTYALILMIIIWAFQLVDKDSSQNVLKFFINKQFSGLSIDFKYIEISLNLLFLFITISYYQINLTVERTYTYLHKLEKKLSSGTYKVEREGNSYLDSYPWLLSVIHRIYVVVLPLVIILFSYKRIVHEYLEWNFSNIINVVILVFIIVVTLLYISNRLLGEKYWSKQKYPCLSTLGRIWFYFNPKPNCLNWVLYKLLRLLHGTNFPVYQVLMHLYSTSDN